MDFSAHPIFNEVSFVVNTNDKIALVGKNGAGKSTLLKIIAGLQSPTSGAVNIPSGISIGYLPQQMNLADDTTLIEETKKAFSSQTALKEELEKANAELAVRTDYESSGYAALLDHIDILTQRIAIGGINTIEAEIERTLCGLGFVRDDFNRPTKEFSGGWRMRIELAKILLQRPDILLLDEPTNHLDIESIQWLEQFLQTKANAVILVSHDRAFLDNVTKRTIELSCGKAYDYKVSYTDFVQLRRERIEQQTRAYENQQKQIADLKDFIERFRYKPTKAIQVQSRIKQLEKIVPIEIDEVDNSRLRLKFPPASRTGDFPLIIENVSKRYGEHLVFENANLTLRRGDKVAFVGKNGEGKSTLIKCIMQQIPFNGNLTVGHNVAIGYFAQNQAQLLDNNLTVFDTIDHVATGDIRLRIRDLLGAFMFGGEAIEKPVKVLSGGEKTRLAMLKLLLEPVNFLILDEPTNHLDMRTKDILKEAIKDFDGTLIVVSHDREFLDGLVDKVYEFADGKVTEHLGGIYDYLHKRNLSSLAELSISKTTATKKDNSTADVTNSAEGQTSSNNLSYFQQKERDKMIKRATKEVSTAEAEVANLENMQSELENKLAAGEASDEILKQYQKVSEQLEKAMIEWEEKMTVLDNLNKDLPSSKN
ncbi:MAG: ABC-F family ATP-binding cassette domain-containing protein [Bacteroides sp.]|nr:ABC-F family ATP-binding cassette domain-containing protein [Bacteroides sp.]